MGIDWEWISGREGEKLDGWFPEPNDPVRRPQASYAVPYDEDYERLDEISVYADLYADDILDKMGNHCDPGNEEAYEETRFDIASEIYDLFLTKLSTIDSEEAVGQIIKGLEDLCFFELFLSKSDFEKTLHDYLNDPQKKAEAYIAWVVDDCIQDKQ